MMRIKMPPAKNDADLLFSVYQSKSGVPSLRSMHTDLSINFGKMLERIGKGAKEFRGGNGKYRSITFHSLRRYVKTTISDLGYRDYSEWFISHSGSTYWRKKESEKAEIFKKVEPYLTFLDFGLERKGADVQTKLQEKDKQIEALVKKQEHFEQLIQSLIDSGQLKPTIKA
jgi:hypothetical protein